VLELGRTLLERPATAQPSARCRRCSNFRNRRQSRQRTEAGPRSPAVNAEPHSTHTHERGPIRRDSLYASTASEWPARHRRPGSARQERHRSATPRGTANSSIGRYRRQTVHHLSVTARHIPARVRHAETYGRVVGPAFLRGEGTPGGHGASVRRENRGRGPRGFGAASSSGRAPRAPLQLRHRTRIGDSGAAPRACAMR
jgi:hypothetical protein